RRYLLVDLGVMNDLAYNKQATVLENFPGGVRQIDRPLDPIAKAEFLREADSRVANANDSASATDFIDNVAAVMLLDLFLHRGHHVGRTQVYFLARRCSAGDQVRAHALEYFSMSRPIFSRPFALKRPPIYQPAEAR